MILTLGNAEGRGTLARRMSRSLLLVLLCAQLLPGLEVEKAERRWRLRVQSYQMWETTDDEISWSALSIGGGHSFIKRVELYGDFTALHVDLPGTSADAGILDLTVRLRLHRRPRYTFFVDAGLGLVYASERTPSSGSRFNFTELGAIGVELPLRGGDYAVSIAARYMHISNAGIVEDARNPGLDGVGLQIGLVRRF